MASSIKKRSTVTHSCTVRFDKDDEIPFDQPQRLEPVRTKKDEAATTQHSHGCIINLLTF
jgi:hypothetical protein